jgi:hypothetical protein
MSPANSTDSLKMRRSVYPAKSHRFSRYQGLKGGIMITASRRFSCWGLLIAAGLLWAGVGDALAARKDADPLPLPPQPPSAKAKALVSKVAVDDESPFIEEATEEPVVKPKKHEPAAKPKKDEPPAKLKKDEPAAKPKDDMAAEAEIEPTTTRVETTVVEGETVTEECELPVCGPSGRFWLRADYLMWWSNGVHMPALVATGPLNTAGTTVLYGNKDMANGGRSGFRTTLGIWINECHENSIEFDYFDLGEQSSHFNENSLSGNTTLARPFYNARTNQESAFYSAYPGASEGGISVDYKNYFQSAGALFSCNLLTINNGCAEQCDGMEEVPSEDDCSARKVFGRRTDLLCGFRYYGLSDSLRIHDATTAAGTTTEHFDNFSTRNNFYGGEIGLRTQLYRGRWSFEVLTKLAMGNTHSLAEIAGQTQITTNNQTTNYYYGEFAGRSNSGSYPKDTFTVVPQLNLELGYQLNRHWRTSVGYSILYWGSVLNSADQYSTMIDPSNVPPGTGGIATPQYSGKVDNFWVQGINLGMEFHY